MVKVLCSFEVYYSNSSQVLTNTAKMSDLKYTGLSNERYNLITSRYVEFQDNCNDLTKEPVKVFDPLQKRSLDELLLIRQVSKDLQKKKEEDVKKDAQAAAVKPEEKASENKEEIPTTEK